MNKMSKDKRDKLILTIIALVGILGVLYTYVYGAQRDRLNTYALQMTSLQGKLETAERLVKSQDKVAENLQTNRKLLEERSKDMAPSGQYYYWFLTLLGKFRDAQQLSPSFSLTSVSQPELIDVGLLPKFQFKAYSFAVRLNGRFHDVGKFIAALENAYPYFRVQSVRLQPNPANQTAPGDRNTLQVDLRVVTLIKSTAT